MTIPINQTSEIAHLRQQIELEYKALNRAMYGPAILASHAVIANRYKQLDQYYDRLSQLVGEQQATAMAITMYETIVK